MIRLDRDTHIYTDTATGKIIPGVTSILKALGDKGYEFVSQEVLERKSEVGKAVHLATQYADEGRLDQGSVDPQCLGYVDAWRRFRAETGFVPERQEMLVHHQLLGYCGTLDCLGAMSDGVYYVIDKKCVANLSPVTAIQVAAYKHALTTSNPDHLKKFRTAAVKLKPDGRYELKVYGFGEEQQALACFLSLLNIKNWKERNNV